MYHTELLRTLLPKARRVVALLDQGGLADRTKDEWSYVRRVYTALRACVLNADPAAFAAVLKWQEHLATTAAAPPTGGVVTGSPAGRVPGDDPAATSPPASGAARNPHTPPRPPPPELLYPAVPLQPFPLLVVGQQTLLADARVVLKALERALEHDPFEATATFQKAYNNARTVLGDGAGGGTADVEVLQAANRALQDGLERIDRFKFKIAGTELKVKCQPKINI